MQESNAIQEQPTGDASISIPEPTSTPEELKREQIRKYYIELQKRNYEKCIEVVMGQTTYSREEAIAGLEKHK